MSTRPPAVWIVVPAFNEAPVIAGVVGELKRTFPDIVVVDDCSTDATADQSERAGAVVVRHPVNLGQGAALQTGIEFALGQAADIVVTFDADGQHDAAEIPRLIEALAAGKADFALGSRFLGRTINIPYSRRLLLHAALLFTRLTTTLTISDVHNGLRAMTRRGAAALMIRQNRMAHGSEILEQISLSRLTYVEVPVTVKYTEYSLRKGQKLTNSLHIVIDLMAGRLHR
jgi:polyprenyl-phospho-N-acetylgalactosaminyl synthase